MQDHSTTPNARQEVSLAPQVVTAIYYALSVLQELGFEPVTPWEGFCTLQRGDQLVQIFLRGHLANLVLRREEDVPACVVGIENLKEGVTSLTDDLAGLRREEVRAEVTELLNPRHES